MGWRTARRKAQKKAKRRRYGTCLTCGASTVSYVVTTDGKQYGVRQTCRNRSGCGIEHWKLGSRVAER